MSKADILNFIVVLAAGAFGAVWSAFITTTILNELWQDHHAGHGLAEYYLDENHEKQFRMKGVSDD